MRPSDARFGPVALTLAVVSIVWISLVTIGANTACTNRHSCTSSSCDPCLIVSLYAGLGIAATALLTAYVIFGPWPGHSRLALRMTFVVGLIAVGYAVLKGATSW